MSINPDLALYLKTPDTLVGTAWVYYGPPTNEGDISGSQYMEAVAVVDGRVLVVCTHDDFRPSRSRWVPIENLLAEVSAFLPLGPAADLAWIRRGRWVVTTEDDLPIEWRGAWQINLFFGSAIHMVPRDNVAANCGWWDVRRRYRPATRGEETMARMGNFLLTQPEEEAPELVETAPPDAPPTEQEPIDAWRRLVEEI